MSAVVQTPSGKVTEITLHESQRVNGRPYWTWRTDGPDPYRWASAEEAQAWIDEVWEIDPKEKAKADWRVEDLTGSQAG